MRLVDRDPARGLPAARRAGEAARRARDHAAVSVAERAWGHALLHCGEVDDAIRHLRRSIAAGTRAGSSTLAAEARLKLAYAVLQRGRPTAALREIDSALLDLDGASAGRGHAQRAIILYVIGRLDEALAGFGTALTMMRDAGDLLGVQRLLINRALVHTDRHVFGAAERDLREAEELARGLDRHLTIGQIANNLGLLETLRGDVPAALRLLDRAEEVIRRHDAQLGTLHQDRAQLLLSVGMVAEARDAAARAVREFRREGRRVNLPQVRLLLADAEHLTGDFTAALADARLAHREFLRQGRPERAALARLAVLRAQLAAGTRPRVDRRALAAMIGELSAAGWPAEAAEARITAAALVGGPDAERLLEEAAAVRRRGPAALRARGCYAQALLHERRRNRPGVIRAARSGLRLLDEHGAALGATDLRAHAAAHRRELVGIGLRTALRGGRPGAVFEWVERGRTGTLHPVRPPADPELARLLTELRAVRREIALGEGGPGAGLGDGAAGPALGQGAPGPLTRRQVALERRIRDHNRRAGGRSAGPDPRRPDRGLDVVTAAELGRALGDRALVEFVALDGEVLALTVVGGRPGLHRLGPLAAITDLTERMPFALHRLARAGGPASGRPAPATARPDPGGNAAGANGARPDVVAGAATLLRSAAARLDRLLLGPLDGIADRPLVVVPTGALHSVPWSVLPSCAGRPVAVAPSATAWHRVHRSRPRPGAGAVAVAGPGLAGAVAEAEAVATIHGAPALTGAPATVDAVLGALAGADVAHVAAHGRLAADNALFSDLLLVDGPLMVYDLERLPRVPRTVVLAACESGRSQVCAGDELLGLGATFLRLGAAGLIGSVVPVPDAQTTPLMVDLHRRVAAGVPAARALAEAQRELAHTDADPASLAAAAGFVCLGS